MKKKLFLLPFLVAGLIACARQDNAPQYKFEYYPACMAPIMNLPKAPPQRQTLEAGAGGVIFSAIAKIIGDGFDIIGTTLDTAADIVTGRKTNAAYTANQAIAEDNLRMASYQESLGDEFSSLQKSRAGAMQALACYRQSFEALISGMKTGAIGRASAQKRLAEIMAGRERAIYILNNLVIIARGVERDYENSLALEAQNTGLKGAARIEYLGKINAATTQAAEMGAEINAIIQERAAAREESAAMTREVNQLMNAGA